MENLKRSMTNKKWALILLIILGVFCLSGCQEAEESYQAGLSAFLSGDMEEAEKNWLLSISQGKQEAIVYADLSLCYLQMGNTEKAEKYMGQAKAFGKKEIAVLKDKGMYYSLLGDSESALTWYRQSLTSDENSLSEEDIDTVGLMAEEEEKLGNYEEAIRLRNLLIEQNYYMVEQEILNGRCYLKMNQVAAACQYFDMATGNENVSPVYYLTIIALLNEKNAWNESAAYFEKGLEKCTFTDETIALSYYYEKAGKTAKARELYAEEASATGRLGYVRILIREKKYEEAEAVLVEMIREDQEPALVYAEYAALKIASGEKNTALQLMTQARSYENASVDRACAWNEVILYENELNYKTAYEKLTAFRKAYGTEDSEKEYLYLSRVNSK